MINKTQVSCRFGRRSQAYDEYAVVQKSMGYSLLELVKEAGVFQNILEIGCGTGFLTELLAQIYPMAKITASDISSEMLTVASKNLSQYENVSYLLKDGENLDLSEKFDLIVSNAAFQWFNDYQQAFTQMERHLLPGGGLIYATFGEQTFYELNQSFQAAHRSLQITKVRHGPEFISMQKLAQITCDLGLSVHLQEENITEKFKCVREFLTSVKRIGANNSSNGNNILIHRKLMLSMMDFYKNTFEQFGQIPATYHIIYGSHKKS